MMVGRVRFNNVYLQFISSPCSNTSDVEFIVPLYIPPPEHGGTTTSQSKEGQMLEVNIHQPETQIIKVRIKV